MNSKKFTLYITFILLFSSFIGGLIYSNNKTDTQEKNKQTENYTDSQMFIKFNIY